MAGVAGPSLQTVLPFYLGAAGLTGLCFALPLLLAFPRVRGPQGARVQSWGLGLSLGWAALLLLGVVFLMPNGHTGSYLGFFAGEVIGSVLIAAFFGAVGLSLVRFWPLMLVWWLLTGGFLVFFTGQRLYDLARPQRAVFTVDTLWRDMDGQINMGFRETEYAKVPSAGVLAELRRQGRLDDLPSEPRRRPPFRLELLSAPESEYLFLPSEYGLKRGEGWRLGFGALWAALLLLTPPLTALLNGRSPPGPPGWTPRPDAA